MQNKIYRQIQRCRLLGIAVFLTGLITIIKLSLSHLIVHESPFLLYILAVLGSTYFGSRNCGIFATLLSAIINNYFFLEPINEWSISDLGQNIRVILFIFEGIVISLFVSEMKLSKQKTEDGRKEILVHKEALLYNNNVLEETVKERTQMLSDLNIKLQKQIDLLHQKDQALQQSESILQSLYSSTALRMGVVEVLDDDSDCTFLSVNPAAAQMFGMTPGQMMGQPASLIDAQHFREVGPMWIRLYRDSEKQQKPLSVELFNTFIPNPHWQMITVCPIPNILGGRSRFSFIVEDITKRKQAEKNIADALKEKEILLQEIHHRIKNNLQIISSLLGMQARTSQNEFIITQLKESQNRIKSIALVHEKLYSTKSLSEIQLNDYTNVLCKTMIRFYSQKSEKLTYIIEIDSTINLTTNIAVSCGLILQELITNTLKYAFDPGQSGCMSIQAFITDQDRLSLTVADNGKGLPPSLDLSHPKTLGLQLVKDLTNQLKGNLYINTQAGTQVKLVFPIAKK